MSNNTIYTCNICNKNYASKSSLSNHNHNIHNIKKYKIPKSYKCKHCDNEYLSPQSRWTHQKCCNMFIDNNVNDNTENKPIEVKPLKEDIQQHNVFEKPKQKLQGNDLKMKSSKSSMISFKVLNDILIKRNINTNKDKNNHTKIQLSELSNENIYDVLSSEEKSTIIEFRLCSINKLIEIAHCGKYNKFKNIIITNLKDNYAYRFDEEKGYFVTVNKYDMLTDIISARMCDIESILDELNENNSLRNGTKRVVDVLIEKIADTDTPFTTNFTKYDNFLHYKANEIKNLLYNHKDKITNDIAMLIEESEKALENTLKPGQEPTNVSPPPEAAT